MTLISRQAIRPSIEVEEILGNHKEAIRLFDEIAASMPDPADQRGWAIVTASGLSDEGKRFFIALGEAAKMVQHPVLGHLVMPPREPVVE
jgi:hypothetical protein